MCVCLCDGGVCREFIAFLFLRGLEIKTLFLDHKTWTLYRVPPQILWGNVSQLLNNQKYSDDVRAARSHSPRHVVGLRRRSVRLGGTRRKFFQVVNTDILIECPGERFEAAWWQESLKGRNKVTLVGRCKI